MSMAGSGRTGGVFWSWPAVVVSMAALLGEVLVVGAALVMYGFTQEGTIGNVFLSLFVLPFAFLAGAVPGFVVTVTLTLPTLWLAGWATRWAGMQGRPAWWWTAAAAPFSTAGAILVYGAITTMLTRDVAPPVYLVLWLMLTVATVPAALVAAHAARDTDARRALRLTLTVVSGAVAAAVVVCLLFVMAFATGLLHPYEPPRLARSALVGVWEDGSGGTLRLGSDGVAATSGLGEPGARCYGAGVWELDETMPSEQAVDVRDACAHRWSIGGTEEQPTLYYFVGDPDEGNRQLLTRRGGAGR